MGVYINMEMPENCALCPVWDAGNCLAASEAIICEYTKRPADCPLVPVPPHGRLVDADRLLTEHMKKKYYHLPNGDIAIPIIDVEHAPAVIETEEVYGQYTDTAGNYHWTGTITGGHVMRVEENDCIYRKEATEFIDKCLNHEEKLQSVERETLIAVKKYLESINAADVRPVVKAHWTDHRTNEHDGEWYCSACGKAITIYMGPDRDDRYSYCPNCGADMREAHDGI